ncbi:MULTISPECIES: extracellular solute-binding protein [unclassified Haladaptatus]|uniref:extracellular solute-binding protein n=1 Tax=unclassified Haladaptatus TaxID=2622732 RepID=UPI0023E79C32|nr:MULTISPECIES: extracellular solute-binding protein [unclassified Haladaptatus]
MAATSEPADSTTSLNEGTSRKTDSGLKRRSVLSAVATGLAAGLAGCTGGGGGGTTASNDGKEFSGVTINAADIGYIGLGPIAKDAINKWASQFEQEKGASVKFNFPESETLLTSIQSGDIPHFWTGHPGFQGQLLSSGIVQGYENEFQDKFPNFLDGGLMDVNQSQIEYIYSQWDDVYNLIMTSKPYAPFAVRMDHMESAGLSADDMPTSYEELIDVATQLRDANDQSLGWQCYAGGCDLLDVYGTQWLAANGGNEGKDGYNWGDDWSAINWRNDTWTEWIGKNVALFQDHNLGAENTPSICDEPALPMILGGELSIIQMTSANHKLFMEQAPGLLEDGTIQYAEPWGGSNNIKAHFLNDGANFATKPQGKDQATWDKSIEASYAMVNYAINETQILSHDFPAGLAYHPSWKEHFNAMPEDDFTTAGNWLEVTQNMVRNSDVAYGYEAHPLEGIAPGIIGPALQEAWKGEGSVEDGLDKAATEMENHLKQSNEPWKNN